MTSPKKRLLLCVRDMMVLTGKSKSTVCRIRSEIKKRFHKPNTLFITMDEFCLHTGITEEEANAMLS